MQDFRPQQNSRPVSLDELSLVEDDAPPVKSTADTAAEPGYQSAYRAPTLHDDWEEDEDVVELAGPGQRIIARLLDNLPFAVLGFIVD